MVLDGERPRRLSAGLRLMERGLAPTLVVVYGEEQDPELFRARDLPFEAISFEPDPPTTRGEARGVARLARERGWGSLVVVTSTYHVTRARMIFRRRVDCEVLFVGAGFSIWRLPAHIVSEWMKLVYALTLARGA